MKICHIDYNQVIGKVKMMHAVNNPPTVPGDSYGLYPKMREAGIAHVRLHDTGGDFGGAHYVDIENIFTDMNADEQNPDSYDFAFTDAMLANMAEYGMKAFYRLGATIENNHHIRAYHIYPPKDPEKWARICENIIRHYTEGWANGFTYDIEYWEIWNEPENSPDIEENPMWKGTMEEYFRLYEVTYRHLKSCFPHLKIGGYASCGFYALSNADFSTVSNSSPRTEYFVEFFHRFLAYLRERDVGLDFFSWHSYGGIYENRGYAGYVRKTLDEYGFSHCESILNEWNPGIHLRGTQRDGANVLSMMLAMQNTPTDMLMYYDAAIKSGYCGLFNPTDHSLYPAYYAFRLFNDIYRLGTQYASESDVEIYTIAASDGTRHGFLSVNHTDEDRTVHLDTGGILFTTATLVADGTVQTMAGEPDNRYTIPPYGLLYLED